MKRLAGLAVGCILAVCLTACQKGSGSAADGYWKDAGKASGMENYVSDPKTQMDLEALKQEASGGDIRQQFKASALLCAQEYQDQKGEVGEASWEKGAFLADYPASGEYAEQFWEKARSDGEEFWNALGESFAPYDCFGPLLAAADHLDGETLAALSKGIPEDGSYKTKLKDALDQWVKKHPGRLALIGDALMESGYYDDWDGDDWEDTYIDPSSGPGQIRTDTVNDALDYIRYMRDTVLPKMESQFGRDYKTDSTVMEGAAWYDTNLMVTAKEELQLEPQGGTQEEAEAEEGAAETGRESQEGAEAAEESLSGTEGKTVVACYRNLQSDEIEGSPAPLRVIGDFMLGLPAEAFPDSLEEADYWLILTPDYEYGDFYQTAGGSDTKIQQIYSSTSIDLYEGSTGKLLSHIGNVMETAPEQIFADYSEEGVRFPEVTSADSLYYIYQNLNNREAYVTLLDNLSGRSELERGEGIILGNWEITFHSADAVKQFDEGMYRYDADEGCHFVRGNFTICNKGTEEDGFMPMVYYIGEDPIVELAATGTDEAYPCVDLITNSKCLNGTYLEPGETKDGQLFFQIPDDLAGRLGELRIKVSLGNRAVYYPVE